MVHASQSRPAGQHKQVSAKVDFSRIIVFFGFFLLGMPLSGQIPEPPTNFRAPSPPATLTEFLVWGLIYTGAIISVSSKIRKLHNERLLIFLLPIFYYLIAIFFSEYASSPLQDALQLIGSTALAILAARNLEANFSDTVQIIHRATFINLLFNFAFVVMMPDQTVSADGRWSSLTGNPNYLASIALVNLFLLMTLSITHNTRGWKLFFLSILPLAIVLGTKSATTMATIIAISLLFLFFISRQLNYTWGSIIRSGIIMMLTLTVIAIGPLTTTFLEITGKNSTLTGRTAIWTTSFEQLPGHLAFGYGIGVTTFDIGATSWATYFHNGLLQILMYMGITGLIIFITPLILILLSINRCKIIYHKFIILGSFLLFILFNYTEVAAFIWRSPVWLLYLIAIFFDAFRRADRKNLA